MPSTIVHHEFEEGEIVYLRTDPEQHARIVMGFRLQNGGTLLVDIMCGTIQSCHYEMELTREKNLVNAL
jgi:hypothetical protein